MPSRTGPDRAGGAQFLFGPAGAPAELAGYANVSTGTTGNRTGGFPVAAAGDAAETHAVCAVRDTAGEHGIEVVVRFTRQAGTTVVRQVAFDPWRR